MDTYLYYVLKAGNVHAVENILNGRNPPDLNICQAHQGNTALHIAAIAKQEEIAKMIIIKCPSLLCSPNSKGDTPLHVAAKRGYLTLTKILTETPAATGDLERGSSSAGSVVWKMRNSQGNTAIYEAIKMGHGDVASYLLTLDHENELVNETNDDGVSLLFLAVEAELHQVVSKIIQLPSFSVQGRNSQTALHMAAIKGNFGIMETLLEHKRLRELIKEVDYLGKTALHYVASNCVGNKSKREMFTSMMDTDQTIAYVADNDRNFPIHVLAMESINVLVDTSFLYPNTIGLLDGNGRNVLHLAAMIDHEDYFAFLSLTFDMRYFINEPDNDGNTPLHLATERRLVNNVAILLEHEILNKAATNKDGLTALDICELDDNSSPTQYDLHALLVNNKASNGSVPQKGRMDLESRRKALVPPTSRLESMAQTLSILATLVAGVTFAAAFTMPGGYRNDSPGEGMPVFITKAAVKAFVVFDTMAFGSSMTVAFLLVWALMNTDPHFLGEAVSLSIKISWIAVVGTILAFVTAIYVLVSKESMALALLIMLLGCIVPFQAFFYRPFSNIKRLIDLQTAYEMESWRNNKLAQAKEADSKSEKDDFQKLPWCFLLIKAWLHRHRYEYKTVRQLKWYYYLEDSKTITGGREQGQSPSS